MYASTLLATLALAAFAAAKTDLEGCTSSETVAFGGASMIYWVPDSGEICAFLDCGGGRAPPKTTVPGCAAYEGTATYTPEYLPGFGEATATPTPTAETDIEQGGQETTVVSSVVESAAQATITTPATFVLTNLPTIAKTGGAPVGNLTGTATQVTTGSPSQPAGTGAANVLAAAGKGLVGLAVGVAGLAVL